MALNNTGEISDKAKSTVLRLFKFRIRSAYELRVKLTAKQIPAPVIEKTLRYFTDCGLIDDRMFAQQWVASRLKKPFGLNRIRLELKHKGIAQDTIEAVLREAAKDYDEISAASELARCRAGLYRGCEQEKKKQRLYGYLRRRGYTPDTIMKAIVQL